MLSGVFEKKIAVFDSSKPVYGRYVTLICSLSSFDKIFLQLTLTMSKRSPSYLLSSWLVTGNSPKLLSFFSFRTRFQNSEFYFHENLIYCMKLKTDCTSWT